MPELTPEPVMPGSLALVVGNGPSNARCPWPAIKNGILKGGRKVDSLWLINASALGRTVPTYAVAVDMDIVASFVRNELHLNSTIVTGHQEKVCGPDRWQQVVGAVAEGDGFLYGSQNWPPLASGPLAVWAAASLGFETIAIYGLDGSLSDGDEVFMEHVAVWEAWLLRWREARPRLGERADPTRRRAQRLLRVWPAGQNVPMVRDPLREALDGSLEVEPA